MKRGAPVIWTLVRVIAAISLTIWCVLHLQVFDHYFGVELPDVVRIPGIVLLATGGGLVLWCGGILGKVGILEERGDRLFQTEFVARGPFRYVRNPMSLGGTFCLWGWVYISVQSRFSCFRACYFFCFTLLRCVLKSRD
jgi:protein-S-isoprenylcysteine O-methyltransferase Ste14